MNYVVPGGPNTASTATTITNNISSSGNALVLHCDAASYGSGLVATGSAYGVQGTGGTYAGVFGDTSNSSAAGVTGIARSSAGGTGVSGSCDATNGVGVLGSSTNGIGVQGTITDFSNAPNTFAVQGINQSTGAGGVGVSGASIGGYGVLGQSAAVGFAGITGITTTANVPAFAGGSSTPSALAAYFIGGVYIDCTTVAHGQFVVNPMAAKSGLLKHPDGSHRLMYSVEAPESWVEDVGTGKLVNGKAEVKLDPDFAAVIHTDDYHVFLTAYGNTNGLHVTQRGATGFTVAEHNAGTNSLTFSWRVMATPKTDTKVTGRLSRLVLRRDGKSLGRPLPRSAILFWCVFLICCLHARLHQVNSGSMGKRGRSDEANAFHASCLGGHRFGCGIRVVPRRAASSRRWYHGQ